MSIKVISMDIVTAFLILCSNIVGTVYKTTEANLSLKITEIICYSQRGCSFGQRHCYHRGWTTGLPSLWYKLHMELSSLLLWSLSFFHSLATRLTYNDFIVCYLLITCVDIKTKSLVNHMKRETTELCKYLMISIDINNRFFHEKSVLNSNSLNI